MLYITFVSIGISAILKLTDRVFGEMAPAGFVSCNAEPQPRTPERRGHNHARGRLPHSRKNGGTRLGYARLGMTA